MSIQSLKHRIHKRVNMKKYKQDYSDIGSFIKKRRKELHVTQDEISNGICSISYLSKIENNQIVPSDFYVKEIMEKLEIDQSVFETSIQDKKYLRAVIDSFFHLEDDKMESLYQEIQDVEHNVVINLCKLGYVVYFQLEDDNQYVMMLEHVINNMTDLEVELYLYFASIYFIGKQKYKTALELLTLYDSLPKMNDMLDAMVHDLSYHVKLRLGMKTIASDDYHHAMTLYQRYHNVHRIIHLAIHKIQSIAREHPKKALTMMNTLKVTLLRKEEVDHYHYLKAQIHVHLKEYHEATLALHHICEDSVYYYRKMTLLLQICMIEGDEEMMDQIKDVLHNLSPDPKEMRAKIHYHYLIQADPESKKQYLRDIAIPFSIKIEDYHTLYEYTMAIMAICIEHSRYKEATQYYHKYEREMNKIERLLY